jgi:GTP cyclohydrolase I
MKTLKNIIKKLEKFASPKLAPFDYVGLIQGDLNQKISKIGLSLDYSLHTIQKAVKEECQLLITHHGPEDNNIPVFGNSLAKQNLAAKSNLAIYRCHLNLDFCKHGIIEELCCLLDIPAKPASLVYNSHRIYGGVRFTKNYPMTLQELINRAQALNCPYIRFAGKKLSRFKRIAITSGQGFIPEFFDQLRPEVYIAGEFEHEANEYARDLGIMLVELSHYASESKPLELIADTLTNLLKIQVKYITNPDTIQCLKLKTVKI